jgi:hypothetical protein
MTLEESTQPTNTALTPLQQEVVNKIRVLKQHTKLTGFQTSRSQSELKSKLSGEDLAAVCRVLNQDPQ